MEENPAYRHDHSAFHREIYYLQTNRENQLKGKSFISDRGTVDAFAFHPETLAEVNTNINKEYDRYDNVIQLGSSASLGVIYYINDNIRRESLAEALIIEKAITKAWSDHRGYIFIKANADFENKYNELLNILLSIISK